jgi:hypothetical protein
MFYLLLLFSLVTLGAGVFLLGFGLPIRETVFGSALLVSGTVALVGTFLLIGLAVAVRELQRVVHGVRRMPGPRPPRPAERREGERKEAERRPPSHRPASSRAHADAPIAAPTSIDEPPYEGHHEEVRPDAGVAGATVRGEPEGRPDPRPPARRPGPAWLRRAISEIEPVSGEPAPPEPLETHHPDPRHHDEPRRHGPGDVPYARPGPPGSERPVMQEGWLRPRAGSQPPIEPEDYAPEPDLRMRPRVPPAAPLEPAPPHEREPEPPPDLRMRPRMPPPAQFEPTPPYEREPEPASDLRMHPRMPPAPQLEPAPVHEPEPEPAPRQPPALPPNIFDIVWPSERRRPANAPEPQPEPPPPAVRPGETRPLPPVQQVPMPGPTPAPPMAAPRPEPPRREPPRPEPRPEPRVEQRPEPIHPEPLHPEPLHPEYLRPESLRPEPHPVSVLKSGVIDEMAYTLFTDGSIEAQMPDGTMRFGSIEELRRHLEQSG